MMYPYRTLPDYTGIFDRGFSANEISLFEQLLHENEPELYELAYKIFHNGENRTCEQKKRFLKHIISKKLLP